MGQNHLNTIYQCRCSSIYHHGCGKQTVHMAFTFMDGIRFDGLYTMLEKVGAENCKNIPDKADNNYLTIREENVDNT